MSARIHSVPTSFMGELVGVQQVVKVPQPAAGTDWSYTLPGGYFYRILGGSASYRSSAVVANRAVAPQITDGANLVWSGYCGSTFAASTTVIFGMSGNAYIGAVAATGVYNHMCFPNVWIPSSYVIQPLTNNMDVGDQWLKVILWLEALDYGALGVPELAHAQTAAERLETIDYG